MMPVYYQALCTTRPWDQRHKAGYHRFYAPQVLVLLRSLMLVLIAFESIFALTSRGMLTLMPPVHLVLEPLVRFAPTLLVVLVLIFLVALSLMLPVVLAPMLLVVFVLIFLLVFL